VRNPARIGQWNAWFGSRLTRASSVEVPSYTTTERLASPAYSPAFLTTQRALSRARAALGDGPSLLRRMKVRNLTESRRSTER
jgi:hypothetical protein